MPEPQDQVLKDVSDRVAASLTEAGSFVNQEDVRRIVLETVKGYMTEHGGEAGARKFKFGNQRSPSSLAGSKFARYGLSIGDIEYAHDFMSACRDLQPNKHKGPSEALENAFKEISEASYMSEDDVKAIDKRAIDDMFPRIPLSQFDGADYQHALRGNFDETGLYKRAMDTAESGYGSQLVGAQYVGELWEAARQESRVFDLLNPFEMTAATAYLPVEADIPELLFVAENTSATASDYATSKTGSNRVQVDAKLFVLHQVWSGSLEEDSILPFVPFLRNQSLLSLAHYSDALVLNGDTTNAGTGNINLDDADPADTKYYLALDGIRKAAIVDNTNNWNSLAGAISLAALSEARGLMLDTSNLINWGHPTDMNDLVFVADPETADKISQLDQVLMWQQFNQGQLLNGQIAAIVGHPIISSIAVSKTEADGKVSTTAGNNTKGQVVAFNRRAFVPGWRRRVRTELERLPGRDQFRLVHSLRLGLGRYSSTGAAAGIEAAAVIGNITL